MQTREDLLYFDFQGWPVFKANLRELLQPFMNDDGDVIIKHDNPILDIYPTTLHDDGGGYGVDEHYLTDIDVQKDRVNVWVEPIPDPKFLKTTLEIWDDLKH